MIATANTPSAVDTENSRLHERIPLTQAAAELPRRRRGRKTAVQTLYRWTTTGCRGVRLRYVQVGCTRCTTRAWLNEFFEALTAKSEAGSPSSGSPDTTAAADGPRTPAKRARDVAKAQAALAARGI